MTNTLLIATTNPGKIREIKQYLSNDLTIQTLADYPEITDIEETGTTFLANAELKLNNVVSQLARKYPEVADQLTVITEDSGLIVDVLAGKHQPLYVDDTADNSLPGVYSARYAMLATGKQEHNHNFGMNNHVVLQEMESVPVNRRNAHMLSTIVYSTPEMRDMNLPARNVRGIMDGMIADKPAGDNGFAYDYIFKPIIDGKVSNRTYAEMSFEEKQAVSHRVKALKYLNSYL